MTDLAQVQAAIGRDTKTLWLESPSNPLLDVLDIATLADLAHQAGARLAVDGTFATPALQRPLALGADLVMHASTKYLGGHSDVQGGVLVFREQNGAVEAAEQNRTILGAVASPFNSWLVLRGLRSLSCRMERHSANALVVARMLAGHPQVERVYYPGLDGHPGYAISKKQMSAFGGMLSFQVKGGYERALAFASRVQLFTNATSLGGVESTLELRAASEGPNSTIPSNLIRVSVGLEAASDLLQDLQQALA